MANILYFGRLADATGTSIETVELPEGVSNTTILRRWLDDTRRLSGVLLEPTIRIAVNNAIAADPAPIANSDEIAFLPPVGGG